jgi:ketosteroid isomerase-like protein
MRRFFSIALVAVGLAAFASRAVAASGQAAVMATVKQFVNNLNGDNTSAALAACASPAVIIDEFPPHEWHGPTACADWLKDYTAYDTQNKVVGGPVEVGTPWHVDVDGATGYVVTPATYSYTDHGKPVIEAAVLTVALKQTPAGWRITGWAWSKH